MYLKIDAKLVKMVNNHKANASSLLQIEIIIETKNQIE
jgi:hypothetical protein